MHSRMNGMKWWLVLVGAVLLGGSCASDESSSATLADDVQQRMIEQRPLVRAASLIAHEIDSGRYSGYASIVIEDKGVALWWKGELPAGMAAIVAEASKTAPVRVAAASYSEADLRAAGRAIRAQLGPAGPFHAIKMEPDGSGLILGAAPGRADAAEAMGSMRRLMPEVDVPTRLVVEDAPTPISRDNDSAPWSGGAVIWNQTGGALCTSGFGVERGNARFILTAAHCGEVGARFADATGELIGFVGDRNTTDDVMLIPTSDVTDRIYIGGKTSNTTKRVTGYDHAFIGELVCQSGISSADQRGGPICNMRVDALHADDGTVEAVQQNGIDSAIPGDSGGPVYSDQGSTVVAKGTSTWTAGTRFGFHDFVTANRDFGVVPVSGTSPGGGGRLVDRNSGKCLDVNGGGSADGTKIQLWGCNGTGAQAFQLNDAGGGLVSVVNPQSGKCLDVDHSGTANGTLVQLWGCNGTGAQKFRREARGGGFDRLVNSNSGKCVDVSGSGSADGTQVHIWDCNGGANQDWSIQ